jgi:hypothetical protein
MPPDDTEYSCISFSNTTVNGTFVMVTFVPLGTDETADPENVTVADPPAELVTSFIDI